MPCKLELMALTSAMKTMSIVSNVTPNVSFEGRTSTTGVSAP
jgi:hypothetical protein